MVSPVLHENYYSGAFLVREANGYLSRDEGEVVNATDAEVTFQGGLVIAAAASLAADIIVAEGNTGDGTIGTVTTTAATSPSNYTLLMTSDTAFSVTDAKDNAIGSGAVGTAFTGSNGLGFTVTAGTTAFVEGDSFVITVIDTAFGQYVPFNGSNTAVGILFNLMRLQPQTSRRATVIKRMAEVNGAELQWDASVTGAANAATLQAAALASLAAAGIVAR
ncbi:phage protein Gp19 [Ameyamaea chiangmaiensis NBRC 103196]|uniref:Head decoration protein n=1 Tax=Ameyamaea chiangmaiensis TaxID=442969 RepID=A0A850P5C1_9PROT|nr:head decoration protein [Ameyamaea chiangmaiensis]MBS4075464.1 head decoration protein [Ameyamaea chiangmaiensis]NVN39004.1 head decoration protein [Ameyamaea chiangmaiensis]GBQ69673.1 phage protein Gp19 [Ameyamaea chiangmaiensis NBRC 103196]